MRFMLMSTTEDLRSSLTVGIFEGLDNCLSCCVDNEANVEDTDGCIEDRENGRRCATWVNVAEPNSLTMTVSVFAAVFMLLGTGNRLTFDGHNSEVESILKGDIEELRVGKTPESNVTYQDHDHDDQRPLFSSEATS